MHGIVDGLLSLFSVVDSDGSAIPRLFANLIDLEYSSRSGKPYKEMEYEGISLF